MLFTDQIIGPVVDKIKKKKTHTHANKADALKYMSNLQKMIWNTYLEMMLPPMATVCDSRADSLGFNVMLFSGLSMWTHASPAVT